MTKRRQAVYEQIAGDIAARIVRGDLQENERLSGRSVLSSEYSVSPETIRRALNLLAEYDCVEVISNYGVIVGNKEAAIQYLESSSAMLNISELKHQLNVLMEKRAELDVEINRLISDIIDLNSRFAYTDPLKRFEFVVEKNSPLLGKTIGSSAFYQKTKMTIIAINRQGDMILSPGPNALLQENDILIAVGHPSGIDDVDTLVHGS